MPPPVLPEFPPPELAPPMYGGSGLGSQVAPPPPPPAANITPARSSAPTTPHEHRTRHIGARPSKNGWRYHASRYRHKSNPPTWTNTPPPPPAHPSRDSPQCDLIPLSPPKALSSGRSHLRQRDISARGRRPPSVAGHYHNLAASVKNLLLAKCPFPHLPHGITSCPRPRAPCAVPPRRGRRSETCQVAGPPVAPPGRGQGCPPPRSQASL